MSGIVKQDLLIWIQESTFSDSSPPLLRERLFAPITGPFAKPQYGTFMDQQFRIVRAPYMEKRRDNITGWEYWNQVIQVLNEFEGPRMQSTFDDADDTMDLATAASLSRRWMAKSEGYSLQSLEESINIHKPKIEDPWPSE